jgi:hypothetical protein
MNDSDGTSLEGTSRARKKTREAASASELLAHPKPPAPRVNSQLAGEPVAHFSYRNMGIMGKNGDCQEEN